MDLSLDENGNVNIPNETVIGLTQDVFGEKIFDDINDDLIQLVDDLQYTDEPVKDDPLAVIKEAFKSTAVETLINTAQETYGDELKPAEKKKLERKLKFDTERIIDKAYSDYQIQTNLLEKEKQYRIEDANEN